ncbi:uncharacterized protein LOC105836309 [Monomorium pharaonis]|uniref:uncharacterized protein LOC105836309 n=1 Tax=Monomorium pharaonis TaxID=307658 RepID=UPI00063FCB0A|nr:uncharacterized protein LOC105836309 [Monomorium pharaonis]
MKMKRLYTGIVLLMYNYMIQSQDVIFPIDEETFHVSGGNSTMITERIPVLIPSSCPENMLLYPGSGSKDSWVCDCKPRFLYFPLNNSCHEAYRQGPCPSGNYVVLPKNEALPHCIENPCFEDGMVPYNGMCYPLRTRGPCSSKEVLQVNETTFQLECVLVAVHDNTVSFVGTTAVPKRTCPLDSCRCIFAKIFNIQIF